VGESVQTNRLQENKEITMYPTTPQPKIRTAEKSYAPTKRAKVGSASTVDGKKYMNGVNSLGNNPGAK
jgi:hypothetical protein